MHPLHEAVRDGDLAKVRALLKENPNFVSSKYFDGSTPLHFAAAYGHRDLAEMLVADKAETEAKDSEGKTPLHEAARHGHKNTTEFLLATGADVNATNQKGATPLYLAQECHHQDVAELLRQHGGVQGEVSVKKDLFVGDIFAGKTEVIWIVVLGILSAAAFIGSLVENIPRVFVFATGAVACVFALPLALIVIAVILAMLIQIFTPRGASAIPLFAWKGGVDGLSSAQLGEFAAKPRTRRFVKVYLWLAVNSLIGAVITLIAFACLYAFMQFAQQQKQHQ